jgi:hypothetical protein
MNPGRSEPSLIRELHHGAIERRMQPALECDRAPASDCIERQGRKCREFVLFRHG